MFTVSKLDWNKKGKGSGNLYIRNPEVLNQDKLYYCYDEDLVGYFIDNGLMYLSVVYENSGKDAWVFSKTDKLLDLLDKYSNSK